MPFRFRLKTLLRHREFKLREAQAALGIAESVRAGIEARIEGHRARIEAEVKQFEKEQEEGIETARYLHFKDHLSFLERELLVMYSELEKALKEVEARKLAMIESDRAVKVLENIETRDRDLYRLAQSRKEQKTLDDVAVFKDYRDRPGGGGKS
jgi:flagellar export protein FliJ